jgi:exodeoxyribonuclease VII small subunit
VNQPEPKFNAAPPLKNAPENRQKEITFESAFARLEQILEKMNSVTVTLDESLELYKEADNLINICSQRLNQAERQIEVLVKNRSGELTLGPDQKPLTQEFQSPSYQGPKPN